MEYNGKELVPITKVQAFEEPKEVVVLISNPWPAEVVYIGQGNRGWFAVTKGGSVIESMVAEIPQYDKSKFKIPHNNATYKEILEASEMTDEEFKGFLKIGDTCSGFTPKFGFARVDGRCPAIACSECPISEDNSKETIETWMNGDDIRKPKMRDSTREEMLYFLWEKNKSECVVARYNGGEYRPYSTRPHTPAGLLDHTFATIDEAGKITEFEITKVEDK